MRKRKKEIKFVCGVGYKGLPVRDGPKGLRTGEVFNTGTKVCVIDSIGDFACIGKNKWVSATYLIDTKPVCKTIISLEPIGVYKKKSIVGNTPIAYLKEGSLVEVFAYKKGWYKVSLEEEAWVQSCYLK